MDCTWHMAQQNLTVTSPQPSWTFEGSEPLLFWSNWCAHKSEHTNCAAWSFLPALQGPTGSPMEMWMAEKSFFNFLPNSLLELGVQPSGCWDTPTDRQHLSVRPLVWIWRSLPLQSDPWLVFKASENSQGWKWQARGWQWDGQFLWCWGAKGPLCLLGRDDGVLLPKSIELWAMSWQEPHFLPGFWKSGLILIFWEGVLEFCCKSHLRFFKKHFPVYRGEHSLHNMKKKISQSWKKLIDFRFS